MTLVRISEQLKKIQESWKKMKKKKIRLKGHETFCIREGWLEKGMAAIKADPKVFSKMYGADALGVGVNMAKAIRYWLKVCELTDEKSGKGSYLSEFGKKVYQYDPYLEQDFTLWCIHINLVRNKELATTWYLFFSLYKQLEEFTRDSLYTILKDRLEKYLEEEGFNERSLDDDIRVLLQMYSREKLEKNDPEDKKICPLAKLGIIRKTGNTYVKGEPNLNRISPEVLWYYLQSRFIEGDAVYIENLYSDIEGVAGILGLSRSLLGEYLDILAGYGYVDINRTAGLDMIYIKSSCTREEVAEHVYCSL